MAFKLPIDAKIVTSSSYVSEGISLQKNTSSFSLYYLITGSGSVDFFVHTSPDGYNFVKQTKALKRGVVAGENMIHLPIIPCDAFKIEVEETAGSAMTVTAKINLLPGQFGDFPVYDGVSTAVRTITYPHHEIHDGNSYFAVYSALANDTGVIEVRIQTANTTKWAHMTIDIDAALAATAQLWYPTTKTDEVGNRITPMNRDHNSSNTSGLTICHTPAGSQAGTANLTQYIGSATSKGKSTVGGDTGSRHEFILDQNNDYLIRLTSRADLNALSIILDWYEHTNR